MASFVVAAMAVLGACRVDARVDVAVAADGSGSVMLTLVADADLVRRAPGLVDDVRFADAVAAGWVVEGPTTLADGGLRVELRHPFADVGEANALLASINGPGGPLQAITLTRGTNATTTAVAGALRVDGGIDAFTDPELLAAVGAQPYADAIAGDTAAVGDVVSVVLRVELPGTVSARSGTRHGSAVEWTAPLDGSTLDVSASARANGGGAWGVLATVALVAMLAWLALGAALLTLVVRARRRRARRRVERSPSPDRTRYVPRRSPRR